MQLAAIIVSLVLTVVGAALFARVIAQFVRFFMLGQPLPAGTRIDNPRSSAATTRPSTTPSCSSTSSTRASCSR